MVMNESFKFTWLSIMVILETVSERVVLCFNETLSILRRVESLYDGKSKLGLPNLFVTDYEIVYLYAS